MGRGAEWRSCGIGLLAALLVGVPAPLASAAAPAAGPPPAARIDVGPLGFTPPSRFYLPYRVPGATLDFLDATHLLFTFRVPELMHRERNDPADDQDQTVRALVLSVPDGKTLAHAEWRLHDRSRYLWPLPHGKFLLRNRDTLLVGDSTLVLKRYLEAEGTLVSVQASPTAKTVAAEYAVDIPAPEGDGADGRPAGAPTLGADAPHPAETHAQQYSVLVVDTATSKATRYSPMPHAVSVPMLDGGYLSTRQEKGKNWSILLNSFGGAPTVISTVSSTCRPMLYPISEHAYLTASCLPYTSDHLMTAFDVSGHKLWEKLWQSRFIWGTYGFDSTGTRFVYGSFEISGGLQELDQIDSSSIVGEPVGVFDVANGDLAAVLDAEPILTAGQNFALSPNGDFLAILRDGAIEIYHMPPAPQLSLASLDEAKAQH